MALHDFLVVLDELAASSLAEAWDNVGLMVGDPTQIVSGVLIALDPTEAVLDEALERGLNTIVTHHPLIFQALKAVRVDQPLGRVLAKAITHGLAVIGCHTNLDKVDGGVSEALAVGLGLIEITPLLVETGAAAGQGHVPGFGRHGRFPVPKSKAVFLKDLAAALELEVIAVVGHLPERISTVAVCGGSGSDLAESARAAGVQVYITGEVKHSTARWAEACDFCIIDAGHYASENPVVPALAAVLQKTGAVRGWGIDIVATARQRNPVALYRP